MKTNKIKLKKVVKSEGHFSARLVVKDVSGYEQWLPYDTRTETNDPANGMIIVFDSSKGIYEAADNLAHAKELFKKHSDRLTFTEQVTQRTPRITPINITKDIEVIQTTTAVIVL